MDELESLDVGEMYRNAAISGSNRLNEIKEITDTAIEIMQSGSVGSDYLMSTIIKIHEIVERK